MYELHSSPSVELARYVLMWVLVVLMLWEPAHSEAPQGGASADAAAAVEGAVLALFAADDVLELVHRCADGVGGYAREARFVTKVGLDALLAADWALWLGLRAINVRYFRWGRLLRVLKLAVVSKRTWLTTKAVLQALPYILDVTLLIGFATVVYALIGAQVLAEAQQDPAFQSDLEADFSSVEDAIATLFTLTTLSNYPGVMLPYTRVSLWYLLYFVPFVGIAVTFFLPIPIAVVYEAFRKHRGEQLIQDQVHQRECLFAAFCCLDTERQGFISLRHWERLFATVYRGRHSRSEVLRLFRHCDPKNTGFLPLQAFFQACELSLYMSSLRKTCAAECACCARCRARCNRRCHCNRLVASCPFELAIFLLILANTAVVICSSILTDPDTLLKLEYADRTFSYIFAL